MKYRILRNILTAAVLTIGSAAMAVVPGLPRVQLHGVEYYYYDVKKGESIYKVAKTLGVTTAQITENNPQALDGLRAGMRLYIPVGNDKPAEAADQAIAETPKAVAPVVKEAPAPEVATPVDVAPEVEVAEVETEEPEDETPAAAATYTHKVKRGESLYGIARAAGMTMDEVIALNPSAAYGVQPGDEIQLPRPISDKDKAPAAPAAEPQFVQPDYSLAERERQLGAASTIVEPEETDTLTIAVVLPFMLEQEEVSKQAQLFTEFYEGLLLAASELNDTPGASHIVISAYDTAGSAETVDSLMRCPEVAFANVIVAPDSEEQLSLIARQMSPDTYMLNVFNVRSQLYKTYPNVIQVNIPHGDLYGEAVGAFVDLYPGYTPVFLARIDGNADKDAFVSRLKERLDGDGVGYEEIAFRNLLSLKDLKELNDSVPYVFVPMSGQRTEFAKITEALRRFSSERPDVQTRLFGYPEWITFRGDYFNRLGENNASIYTRFYVAPDSPARAELDTRFRAEYGTGMLDAAPVQGVLGYDTGMYLINALRENHGDFSANPGSYVGIQSAFSYPSRDDEAAGGDGVKGIVNHAIFVVTFGPNGYIDKQLRL